MAHENLFVRAPQAPFQQIFLRTTNKTNGDTHKNQEAQPHDFKSETRPRIPEQLLTIKMRGLSTRRSRVYPGSRPFDEEFIGRFSSRKPPGIYGREINTTRVERESSGPFLEFSGTEIRFRFCLRELGLAGAADLPGFVMDIQD